MTRLGAALTRLDIRAPGADLPLLSVSQTRGVIRRSELTDKPPRAETLDVYKVCRRGDLVFNKMSIRAGALGVAREDGLVTYHYEVMRPRPGAIAEYLVYLMKSWSFIGELILRERGIGAGDQANVRTTEVPFKVLRSIDVYLPPPGEQAAIVDLLNRETAKIDDLVDKQNRLIAKLRERRTAVIAEALEKRPGRAPLKRLASIALGKMLDAGKVVPADAEILPYVRAANVTKAGVLDLADLNSMPFTPAERSRLDLRADDVLVVEGGAMGRPAYLPESLPGLSFQKTINRVRPIPGVARGRYLFYALAMLESAGFHVANIETVSMPHLTAEKLMVVPIPMAGFEEQEAIVAHLDEQTAKIDTLIAKAEQFIELAQERRAALITGAVTGQIDVRDHAKADARAESTMSELEELKAELG